MGLFGKKKDQTVIDLRHSPPQRFEFGLPTPCPACGKPGYLDSIDLIEHVMYQHCPTCFKKWKTAERDLAQT